MAIALSNVILSPSAHYTASKGAMTGPLKQAATKKAAAKSAAPKAAKPKAAAGPQPAMAAAAQRYTGAFSGALNNLSDQEQRAHDVAARRQADAKQYAAYVMGQQGHIAAAGAQADQAALSQSAAITGATNSAALKLQAGLQAANQAAGVQGAVPAQQQAGLVADQQRTNSLLSNSVQHQADQANSNKGKAGFLAAAAQASMLANQRGIAGDEFNQVADINREKTSVLGQRTNANIDTRRAREANAAAVAQAQIKAQSDAADRQSRADIANANNATRAGIAQSSQDAALERTTLSVNARIKAAKASGSGGKASLASTGVARSDITYALHHIPDMLAHHPPLLVAEVKNGQKTGRFVPKLDKSGNPVPNLARSPSVDDVRQGLENGAVGGKKIPPDAVSAALAIQHAGHLSDTEIQALRVTYPGIHINSLGYPTAASSAKAGRAANAKLSKSVSRAVKHPPKLHVDSGSIR